MSDLYWLTVVGNLNDLFVILLVLIGIIGVFALVIAMFAHIDGNSKRTEKVFLILRNYALPSFIVLLIANTFVPSKKDLYFIYGIGTTIDYLKQNPEAKQLPDKVIHALNEWVDNIVSDDSQKE